MGTIMKKLILASLILSDIQQCRAARVDPSGHGSHWSGQRDHLDCAEHRDRPRGMELRNGRGRVNHLRPYCLYARHIGPIRPLHRTTRSGRTVH